MAGAGWWSKKLAGRRTTYEDLELLIQKGSSLEHVKVALRCLLQLTHGLVHAEGARALTPAILLLMLR